MYRGRFAPSPTGRIHLGVARTSLAAWLDARAHGGKMILRIEDIDLQRNVPGAAEEIQRDLEWLGLDWDEGPHVQSACFDRYEAALVHLQNLGRIYFCSCSRKEIMAASSAPHGPGDEGPRYSGKCRENYVPRPDGTASVRLRTEPGDSIAHKDRLYGAVDQNVFEVAGDFILRRADKMWAYQLAVSADDLAQGVTMIVRGVDLLRSTPRQILLRRLLDPQAPSLQTLHLPLVLGPTGQRLAKRDGAIAVADHRNAGRTAEQVIGELAFSLGQTPNADPISARELIAAWNPEKVPKADRPLSEISSPASGDPR